MQLEGDLNIQDRNGWSPVHVAAGMTFHISFSSAQPNLNELAAASGNVDMLLWLLSSSRFDVTMLSSDGSTPLHYLIRSFPEPSETHELPDEGPEVSGPFHKFSTAVRQLILKGKGNPAACSQAHFLMPGVDIRATNKNGETVLHRASLSGKAAAIRWLAREEQWAIDINTTTK